MLTFSFLCLLDIKDPLRKTDYVILIYKWYTSCVLQIQPKDGCFSLEEPLKKDQDLCTHYDVLCLEMWT